MKIDDAYFDQLPPIYQAAVERMWDEYDDAYDEEEDQATINAKRREILQNFMNKYTAIPQIWGEWKRLLHRRSPAKSEQRKLDEEEIKLSYFLHLFDDTDSPLCDLHLYMFKFPYLLTKVINNKIHLFPNTSFVNILIKDLIKFPNTNLKDTSDIRLRDLSCFEVYQQTSTEPITTELEEQYQRSLNLYEKIIDADDDDETWLSLIKEVNDEKFIIQNVECRIGKKPWNKELWRFLIQFLEEKEQWDDLLNTYSRYCRFFLEDVEMREKYKNEYQRLRDAKIISKLVITKWRPDFHMLSIFDTAGNGPSSSYFNHIERNNDFFKTCKDLIKELTVLPEYAINLPDLPERSPSIPFQLLFKQNFSLPETLLRTILSNASPEILRKLYAASKQLYSMTKIPVCHQLKVANYKAAHSFQHALLLPPNNLTIGNAKRIYLSNSLIVYSSTPTVISTLVPKIFKCSIQFLCLEKQNLSLDEFKFLVQFVKTARFSWIKVITNGNEIVPIRNLIENMPKIININFSGKMDIPFANDLMKSVPETKLERFYFAPFLEVNPVILCDFFKKYAAPKSYFVFIIVLDVPEDDRNTFKNLIKEAKKAWEPKEEKPVVTVSFGHWEE